MPKNIGYEVLKTSRTTSNLNFWQMPSDEGLLNAHLPPEGSPFCPWLNSQSKSKQSLCQLINFPKTDLSHLRWPNPWIL